jgi:hypothetical protein
MDSILANKLDAVRELYQYWQTLTLDGFGDERDPVRDLPRLAGRLIVIDVSAKDYRYIHFGAEIAGKLDTDPTGRTIGVSNLVENVKMGWQQLLRSVALRRTPRLVRIDGDEDTVHHILALPLIDANRKTKRVLAGVFLDSHPTKRIIIRGWRRLDVESL